MRRLAALVPRPRLHLIRFYGVLAPDAKLRSLLAPQEAPQGVPQEVPQGPKSPAQAIQPVAVRAIDADTAECPQPAAAVPVCRTHRRCVKLPAATTIRA